MKGSWIQVLFRISYRITGRSYIQCCGLPRCHETNPSNKSKWFPHQNIHRGWRITYTSNAFVLWANWSVSIITLQISTSLNSLYVSIILITGILLTMGSYFKRSVSHFNWIVTNIANCGIFDICGILYNFQYNLLLVKHLRSLMDERGD